MTSTTTVELDGSITVEYWPLATVRDYIWEQVKARRAHVEFGGCDTPKGRVDTTQESKVNISGAVADAMLALQAGAAFLLNWTMADNSVVAHNAMEMIAMGQAVAQHIATTHAIATALRGQIYSEDVTEVPALEAIDIDGADWPA